MNCLCRRLVQKFEANCYKSGWKAGLNGNETQQGWFENAGFRDALPSLRAELQNRQRAAHPFDRFVVHSCEHTTTHRKSKGYLLIRNYLGI